MAPAGPGARLPILAGQRTYLPRVDPHRAVAAGRRRAARAVRDKARAARHAGHFGRPARGVLGPAVCPRLRALEGQRDRDAACAAAAGDGRNPRPRGSGHARQRGDRRAAAAAVSRGDPGLQPQRTALAWSRTSLAVFVNALVVLRTGAQADKTPLIVVGILLLVAAAAGVMYSTWRRQRLLHDTPPGAAPVAAMLGAAAVTWLACVGGLACVMAGVG